MNYYFNISDINIELKLEGDIDLYKVFEIKGILKDHISENPSDLTIDLKGVNYIDSSGIGMLVDAKKMIEEKNKTYRVINIPDDIMQLFKTVSLDRILQGNLEIV